MKKVYGLLYEAQECLSEAVAQLEEMQKRLEAIDKNLLNNLTVDVHNINSTR